MKISTVEAAKQLGVHPTLLLFFIIEREPSLQFEEVWPDIDKAWIETISILKGIPQSKSPACPKLPETVGQKGRPIGLSDAATRVVDKLRRHAKWGHISVPFDALVKLTHLPSKELNMAIVELRKQDLLDHDGDARGTISLNSAKTREIELIKLES